MEEALSSLGMDGAALGFAAAGLLVLLLAVRAARNAAIALRARLFAFATGIGLLGWGLKGPLRIQALAEEAFGPWLDDPHEQVVAALLVLGTLLGAIWIFSIYLWVRAFIRLASFALVGLVLLSLAGLVWLAQEGGLDLALPPVLGIDGLVLAQVAGIALLVLGALRALRPRSAPAAVRRPG